MEVARKLLDAGAIVDAETCSGERPLDCALGKGLTDVIQLLRERGASDEKT